MGMKRASSSAPVATQKVDPAYPMELMRRNVHGTVTLYAVIRNDGSVTDIRVLRGVDDNLDEFARAALSRWRFRPATKNGSPVDLEAVIMIPFPASAIKIWFLVGRCAEVASRSQPNLPRRRCRDVACYVSAGGGKTLQATSLHWRVNRHWKLSS